MKLLKDVYNTLKKVSVPPKKIICLDIETTGLEIPTNNKEKYPENEILQMTILNGEGKVLFNQYCQPIAKKEWPEAEEIHHISPEKVKKCPSFLVFVDKIQEIVDNAEVIVTYNGLSYDIPYLEFYGISFENKEHYDVIRQFAPVYGEWHSDKSKGWKYQKLTTCAEFFGFKPEDDGTSAHDSLWDTRATLYAFQRLQALIESAEIYTDSTDKEGEK